MPNSGYTQSGTAEWIDADQEDRAMRGSPVDALARRVRNNQAQAAQQVPPTPEESEQSEQNQMNFPV